MQSVLVIGATGMLGHQCCAQLSQRFSVTGTVRGDAGAFSGLPAFRNVQLAGGISTSGLDGLEALLADLRPHAVLNCVGVIKQLASEASSETMIATNALFPHQLARLCGLYGSRLIHFSTDCVFSGAAGNYSEGDLTDARDVYGLSKLLGEVTDGNALTLRTSIIGLELNHFLSLAEWVISNKGGKVRGFTNAIFSGFTTPVLARLAGDIIASHPDLSGLYHASAEPISKYDLVKLINDELKLGIEIEAYPDFRCDRSLDSSRLQDAIGFRAPSWQHMIAELGSQYAIREQSL